ncbi:hypothetical protein OL67_000139 [Phaeobacter piscinae]|nr:hypothetical protein OL67_000139 [Phaeobacter piscinae]
MPTTNLNISVTDKRVLRQSEAASYSGLAVKHFKTVCPVPPFELKKGELRWDKRDLDKWIDSAKSGIEAQTQQDILGRL